MKKLFTLLTLATLLTSQLFTTACTKAQVAAVESNLTKYAPLGLDALAIYCDVESNALCQTLPAKVNGDLAILDPLLTKYESDLAAGTATVTAYNDLNAAFAVVEGDMSQIFELIQVSNPKIQQDTATLVPAAQALFAVIEALWPGAPPVVTASLQAPQIPALKPVPSRFHSSMPSGVVFSRKSTPSQKKEQGRWLATWTKKFNAAVDAAKKAHPNAKLEHVKVVRDGNIMENVDR